MKEFKELKSSSGYIIVDRVCLRFRRLVLELREENVQDQEENQIQMKGMEKLTAHSVQKEDPKERKRPWR